MQAYDVKSVPTPRLRGRIHQVAFILSIPLGLALVALAAAPAARAASAVYAFSVSALFGISASYHRIPWTPAARRIMQRLDHASIFVLIAGTYTPFGLLALRGPWKVWLPAAVWVVAAAGIVMKVFHLDRTHSAGMALYLGLGWSGLIALPNLAPVGTGIAVLLVAGGVIYTVGAVLFWAGRPNPNPRVFGYHEFWHTMVAGASACHYAMVLLLARATL